MKDEREMLRTIAVMEERCSRIERALRSLENAGFVRKRAVFSALKKEMNALFSYYGSAEWFAARDLMQQGELPEGLRCGVLTEDTVYDLISDCARIYGRNR